MAAVLRGPQGLQWGGGACGWLVRGGNSAVGTMQVLLLVHDSQIVEPVIHSNLPSSRHLLPLCRNTRQ